MLRVWSKRHVAYITKWKEQRKKTDVWYIENVKKMTPGNWVGLIIMQCRRHARDSETQKYQCLKGIGEMKTKRYYFLFYPDWQQLKIDSIKCCTVYMITVENYFFYTYIEKSLAEVNASQVTTGTGVWSKRTLVYLY